MESGRRAGSPRDSYHHRGRERGGVSPDGKLLATADADGTVRVWNPAGGQAPLATYTGNGAVNGVAFSPDGKLLATADADGTVRLWNTATGHEAGAPLRAGTGTVSTVAGVAFSPDGKLLATADADGTVRLWNTATHHEKGAPLSADTGPAPGVNGVALQPRRQAPGHRRRRRHRTAVEPGHRATQRLSPAG